MRAIRATALTGALIVGLLGASASGALAASGGKAKGYIVTDTGTLSFHASAPNKGGFELTVDGETTTGKVLCYSQGPTEDGVTYATLVGQTDQGTVTLYLKDGGLPDSSTDAFIVVDTQDCAYPTTDFSSGDVEEGYIDIRK
jgi:hypothetical protein